MSLRVLRLIDLQPKGSDKCTMPAYVAIYVYMYNVKINYTAFKTSIDGPE